MEGAGGRAWSARKYAKGRGYFGSEKEGFPFLQKVRYVLGRGKGGDTRGRPGRDLT